MRKLAVALSLLAACYRTTEWGSSGEYRGHATHTSEQQVGVKQTASFDEHEGLHATVTSQGQCRPLLLGDQLEQKEESRRELRGTGWMIGGSLLVGAAGAFGILFAAADANNQDVYGNPLPPRLSSSTRTDLIVAGSAVVLLAIGGIVAAVELPSEKRDSRWTPVPGNPKQVFTSDEPQPCASPATPAAGVAVHVEARFDRGTFEWDVPTDSSGTATIDLATARAVAGWCGEGTVNATVLDQTWHGTVDGTRGPVDQISDAQGRALAVSCGAH